jgi:hypothetical protein
MLYAGRLQSGRFQIGEGDELSVIAACVLGGTSLFGGKGTVIGTVVGALMIGLINNGLILMGLEFSQQLLQGQFNSGDFVLPVFSEDLTHRKPVNRKFRERIRFTNAGLGKNDNGVPAVS